MAARLNGAPGLERLSVVVPVGPGDAVAPALRAQLARLPAGAEVHAVFATAGDAAHLRAAVPSADAAAGPAWHVQLAPRGRAAQQNAGAAAAARPWLWFVHADSRLAPQTLPALDAFLRVDTAALGYFDLRFLDDGPASMRINEIGAWLRSRWLGLPFGDQGLVLPRAVFDALGGFDAALARGEDHDLVWRARRAGIALRPLRAPLYTSARRYTQRGWARATASTLLETCRQARRFARGQRGA